MVQKLAWWWLYGLKHVATFMIDNKLVVFWLNELLEYLVKTHRGGSNLTKKATVLPCRSVSGIFVRVHRGRRYCTSTLSQVALNVKRFQRIPSVGEAVSRRPLTIKAHVRYQGSSYGVCGRSCIGIEFFPSTLTLRCRHRSTQYSIRIYSPISDPI